MQGLISSVKHGSLAEAAGIKAGESLAALSTAALPKPQALKRAKACLRLTAPACAIL